jgi:hypothetical protein
MVLAWLLLKGIAAAGEHHCCLTCTQGHVADAAAVAACCFTLVSVVLHVVFLLCRTGGLWCVLLWARKLISLGSKAYAFEAEPTCY